MYSPSIGFVCKLDILRIAPRHLIQTARVSPPEATPPYRSQRWNRRPSTRPIPRAYFSCARCASSFPANSFPRLLLFPPRTPEGRILPAPHLLCPPRRRAILAGVLCDVMSTGGSARGNDGSKASALGAPVRTPSQTLGRGVASVAAAGHGGGRGVGLPPPPRSRGRGGAPMTTLPTTTPFTMDGFRGGVPSSSTSMGGFPFSPASSPPLIDAADGDPSSPSW
jgi:hypothetical protein